MCYQVNLDTAQLLHHCGCELPGAGVPAQVLGLDPALPEHAVHRAPDLLRVLAQARVLQQVGRGQQHPRGIGHVLARHLAVGVPGPGLLEM